MKGKAYLIKKGVGKIIFSNGEESSIISFPTTFEYGDDIEVAFKENNINEKPIRLIGYSHNHYGFVIQQFSYKNGIILTTYPSLEGTILYKNQTLQKNQRVKFSIKKSIDGTMEAIDITPVDKKDIYKCNLPKFGKLELMEKVPKESFVSKVVTAKGDLLSGNIKAVRQDKGFGFIRVQDEQDVYFKINQFQKIYNKSPKNGDKVRFTVNRNKQGISVKVFMKSHQDNLLPKNEQYGIVNNTKFLLKDFIKVYGNKPQEGDIVYYILKDNKVIFKKGLDEIEKTIVFKQKSNLKITKNKIISVKDRFGFIKGKKKNIFFSNKKYRDFYKKEPKVDDIVQFTYFENDKGLQVKKFYDSDALISRDAFKNFVEIDATQLYYAYIESSNAKEIYKYNPDTLSESISCYKDKNVESNFKLQAIDCLIKENYSDKNIRHSKLIKEKESLLNQLKNNEIENNNLQKALDYEVELQNIDYNPQRIKKFSNICGNKYLFEESDIIIKEIINSDYVDIIMNQVANIEPIENKDFYDIIEKVEIKDYKPNYKKWEIIENKGVRNG